MSKQTKTRLLSKPLYLVLFFKRVVPDTSVLSSTFHCVSSSLLYLFNQVLFCSFNEFLEPRPSERYTFQLVF